MTNFIYPYSFSDLVYISISGENRVFIRDGNVTRLTACWLFVYSLMLEES